VPKKLSHPFRLTPSGRVATVEQDSDQANGELLAVLVRTETGERPLQPEFGVTDPRFSGVEPTEIAAGIEAFGPDVTISALTVTQADPGTVLVHIDYS
jgi:phage baseplate assembly protein W